MEERPTPVPEAKQVGEVQARWAWTEPAVWTERMLTALEVGVKGHLVQSDRQSLQAAEFAGGLRESESQPGSRGSRPPEIEMFEADLDTNLSKVSQQLA